MQVLGRHGGRAIRYMGLQHKRHNTPKKGGKVVKRKEKNKMRIKTHPDTLASPAQTRATAHSHTGHAHRHTTGHRPSNTQTARAHDARDRGYYTDTRPTPHSPRFPLRRARSPPDPQSRTARPRRRRPARRRRRAAAARRGGRRWARRRRCGAGGGLGPGGRRRRPRGRWRGRLRGRRR